jgi:AcrR family transcriptional regulator
MVYAAGRDALLRAGREAVQEHGLDGVTTRDVCARAGVGAPTLYHHFGSREGMLQQLLADAQQRYLADKDEIVATGDPATDLRRGWDRHIAFARSQAALYPILLRPGSEVSSASLDRLQRGFEHLSDIGALRGDVTAGEATTVLSSALRGIASRLSHTPDDLELRHASELLRDAVIDALLTTDGSSHAP